MISTAPEQNSRSRRYVEFPNTNMRKERDGPETAENSPI
jgi:hypothetical protein